LESRGLVALAVTVAVVLGIQSWAGRSDPPSLPAAVGEIPGAALSPDDANPGGSAPEEVSPLDIEYDHRTDVNSASRSALMRLPGIGEVLADRIIASREKDGPFHGLHELERVFGIGPKKVAMLGGWVRFESVVKRAAAGEAAE
jgi:competence ComEA-like helix-hairpin-helix protein